MSADAILPSSRPDPAEGDLHRDLWKGAYWEAVSSFATTLHEFAVYGVLSDNVLPLPNARITWECQHWALMRILVDLSMEQELCTAKKYLAAAIGIRIRMWKGTLIKEMTEAGEEEKMLAEAAGDFCEDGTTPWITVVVDGGWSHRSHGHRYSANSGVAVIVGKRTQKLLYLGEESRSIVARGVLMSIAVKVQVFIFNWDPSGTLKLARVSLAQVEPRS
ncbi:hypothetical protein HPB52_006264 [Rhipicephalus sanguineus]|uniref:Nuclear pore complex protein n=1 Tax=Rhipicephalus sanguineus TaxID=34632 RepID=A0A9D4QH00_RHISA|nr:hypothetical protein HPB52_006264 [Rhipicephalus sanguineus]